jgi:YD repeat-containing protein
MNLQMYPIKLNYVYDKLGRLSSVTVQGGQEISYTYDATGNQTSVIIKGDVTPAPTPKSPKKSSQKKQSSTLIDVKSTASADATLIESGPASVEITVLSGELENQHFPIGDHLSLGREKDNDLTLPDKKASRHHAILQRQGAVYQITDLNSGNGTYVNGQRIAQPTTLKKGDIILIGDTQLSIRG